LGAAVVMMMMLVMMPLMMMMVVIFMMVMMMMAPSLPSWLIGVVVVFPPSRQPLVPYSPE